MSVQQNRHSLSIENNFDLIRLFAALQVAVKHTLVHFEVQSPLVDLLGIFPGVPVFFVISGFMIFQSYERSGNVRQFFRNRFLRIYPALCVCFAVSLLAVWQSGYFAAGGVGPGALLAWAAAQLSILQMYNPGFMRSFGVGVLNGSLWTISVEMTFYLLTPLVFLMMRKRGWVLPALIVLSCAANVFMPADPSGTFAWKLLSVTFVPWWYMFLAGGLVARNAQWLHTVQRAPLALLLVLYGATGVAGKLLGAEVTGNALNPVSFVLLAAVVFKLAYTAPHLAGKLLRRRDLSYGVYIYHMPVVNLFVHSGLFREPGAVLLATAASLALAFLSWVFVEKPALSLKRPGGRTPEYSKQHNTRSV